MSSSTPKKLSAFTALVLAVVLGVTFYAVFMLNQAKSINESLDFSAQKEYRNFARGPARWERMSHHVARLNYNQNEETIEDAFVAIDVVKLRINILQNSDFSKYNQFYESIGKNQGSLSVNELQTRFDRMRSIVNAIEEAVIDVEDGQPLKDISALNEEGIALIQTIEATIARYTLVAFDKQVEAMDTFFGINFNLFLISVTTLFGVSAFAIYSAYQQRQLNEALQKAAKASQAKDAFLANISHELRTPLNAIIGTSHLALRETKNNTLVTALNQIQRSGQLLTSLVDDVLDIAKNRSEDIKLDPVTFDLKNVIADVHSTGKSLVHNGVVLHLETNIPAQTYVHADSIRLQQVLNNLVSNACKFTSQGEVSLVVQAQPENDTHLRINFQVRDTGIGIPEQHLENLFTAFYQVDGSTRRAFGGTGLGLAISQAIVKAMDSEIQCKSQPGQGSTFSFSLTLKTQCQVTQKEKAETTDLSRMVNARILLVEDNPVNLKIARALLERKGVRIHTAEDGFKACDTVEEIGPTNLDLILMDIEMPGMDGHETTIRLNDTYGTDLPPIIALSAHAFDSERDKALSEGMVDFVTKPVKPEHLYQSVLKHLRQ